MPEGAELETAALRLSSSYRRLAGMAVPPRTKPSSGGIIDGTPTA
jgi:hypothetical protein